MAAAEATTTDTRTELPPLIACAGNCGFYGDPSRLNLCSKCYRSLLTQAQVLPEQRAIQHLLQQSGYASLDDVKVAVMYRELYPPNPEDDQEPEGAESWITTTPPLSQFDSVPERGASACTYIAAVTALRMVLRGESPTPDIWSDCIVRGVRAFHEAKAKDPALQGAAGVSEVLPYVLPVLGLPSHAHLVDVHERVVGLYSQPGQPEAEFLELLGPNGYPRFGKEGLVDCLNHVLTSFVPDAEDNCAEIGLVLTRPPESYCVVRNGNGQVFFRDSHRRKQHDFVSLESFMTWLAKDKSFSSPLSGCSLIMNQVGVYVLVPTVSGQMHEVLLGAAE